MTRTGPLNTATLLSSFTGMVHDGAGNRTYMSASIPAHTAYSGNTSYTYDSKDQLTQESSTRAGGYTNNFSYDSAGNATSFKGTSHSYNSNNQDTGNTYDGNGNPTTYKGTTCTFDVENRMASYGSVLTATYRGDGLRAKTVTAAGTTYFLYDGEVLLAEMNGSGSLTAVNTWGAAGLVSRTTSGGTTFYTFDPQGSVVQRLDGTGAVLTSHVFDGHGRGTSTGSGDCYGYCGRAGYYGDAASGLLLLTRRFYDSSGGRFINRDPIGYAGGVNSYSYSGNAPIMYDDPLGTDYKDAVRALKEHRTEILAVSKAKKLQPELLAGVLFVEWYAGGVSGWKQANDLLSQQKFIAGYTASLGIYNVQQNPDRIPGCETSNGRKLYLAGFDDNSFGQAMIAADYLDDLVNRPNRYPNRNLNAHEMAVILTEYNRGPTTTPAASAQPSKYGKRFLGFLPDIKRYLYGGK